MRLRTVLSLPRRSRAFDLALAVLGGVGIGVGTSGVDVLGPPLPVAISGTVLLALLLFLFRRTAPSLPFAVSAASAAWDPAVMTSLLVTSYAMGRYVGRWPPRTCAAVLGCLAVARPWAVDAIGDIPGAVVGGAVVVLLPGAVGAYVRTRAELLAALQERAERAEAQRELLARDAVLTERTRIAREMHDAVGHRVSLMVLQAGAIEMAAGDPDRVARLAEQVQHAGRQALDELRQAVGVLRSADQDAAPLAPQPGLEDLGELIEECRAAGMPVELRQPAAAPVDPVTSRAAYRIVQEALTNAGKHAPGAPVSVTVDRGEEELVVQVRNGAGKPVDGARSGGFGLIGLRERVRTLGGRLRAEPRLDGGFEVEAVLPV